MSAIKTDLVRYVYDNEDVEQMIDKYVNDECPFFFRTDPNSQKEMVYIDGRMSNPDLKPFKNKDEVYLFIEELYAHSTILQMIEKKFKVDSSDIGKAFMNVFGKPVIAIKPHMEFFKYLSDENNGEEVAKLAKKEKLKFKTKKDIETLKNGGVSDGGND